ncbi:MAG: UDP-N-acetylmuramoyl-tripeptide--D-alanyl-D-alanine ligase [Calditrichaeota bacterium]|nr:UDP-N-acetylmuramoyl-tripeptide--D-alanyl-D-alanine ligase [Calditrichota bacterium]
MKHSQPHGQHRQLQEFVHAYAGTVQVVGDLQAVDYRRLSIDSRTMSAGDFFIALKGERFDAHDFLPQVVEKSPAAVVINPAGYRRHRELLEKHRIRAIVVEDTLHFLQELSRWHRLQYAIPVVGVTGSSGKTTTREMIAAVLERKYRVVRSAKNQNNQIGVPLSLLKIDAHTEVAVLELGTNQPGEIGRLTELVQPTIGVITHIGKGHIGFFGSQEAIFREKTAMFDGMAPGSTIVLNMEDPYLRTYQREDVRIVRAGLRADLDVWGRFLEMDALGCVRWRLNDTVDIQLHIPGRHNLLNAVLASAVGLELGLTATDIQQALEAFRPAHQRMEYFQRDGVLFINDAYNANPDSVRAALQYVCELPHVQGKRIVVLGDMLELGEFEVAEHRALGDVIAELPIQMVLLYGPLMKHLEARLHEVTNAGIVVRWFDDHAALAAFLKTHLNAGDVVLVKGSRGMQMERVLENLTVE